MKYVLADMDTYEIVKEIEGDYGSDVKAKNYAYALNGSSLRWYKKDVFEELRNLQEDQNMV